MDKYALVLPVSRGFLDDGAVADDWTRLGQYVVARRIELGYKKRPEFAEALGITARVVGDIETGRRSNFDATTIARLENVLKWETGSAARVASGGEPTLKAARPPTPDSDEQDPVIRRVLLSNLSEDQKRQLVRMLIDEKRAVERERINRVEDLIRLIERDN